MRLTDSHNTPVRWQCPFTSLCEQELYRRAAVGGPGGSPPEAIEESSGTG
jgi:hypothetical protein